MFYADGNLVQDGQDEKSSGPDTDGDEEFVNRRIILHDFFGRGRDKTAKHKADAFIQPEGEEYGGAADTKPEIALLSGVRMDEQGYSDQEEDDKAPHERYQVIIHMAMMLQAEEQILQGVHVAGNVGVKTNKELQTDKEHVGKSRINDDGHHFIDLRYISIRSD